MRGRVVHALITGALLVLVAWAPPAQAAFPGQNGKIAYSIDPDPQYAGASPYDIYTIDPDGSSAARLTSLPDNEFGAAWSPDGRKIAFAANSVNTPITGAIYRINADGSGLVRLTNTSAVDGSPAWSPDGSKIVFTRFCAGCQETALYTMNADGTGQSLLVGGSSSAAHPSWAPDGSKIAFTRAGWYLYLVNPDGTGLTPLPGQPSGGGKNVQPDWSPDSQKIAFAHDECEGQCEEAGTFGPDLAVYTINRDGTGLNPISYGHSTFPRWSPDGTKIAYAKGFCSWGTCNRFDIMFEDANGSGGVTNVTNGPANVFNLQPSWQPIPYPGYPRPKGASPVRVSLVPAYAQCTAPNAQHGSPLASGSCTPPAEQSGNVTVGTSMTGFIRYSSVAGDPDTEADEADMSLEVQITDVREQGTLADYAGEIRPRTIARLTDRTGPATVSDLGFSLDTQCTPTPATNVGSTCSITTSLDTLIPGAIAEGRRSLLELSQVEVIDGGADGDTATQPNSVFLRQGVFVP